jgi:Na+-transporting NADH:ubiquinone oxidoreductase subunit A
MKTIKIKNGWRFKIAGKPSLRMEIRPPVTHVASVPWKYPFVNPRLSIKKGDSVKTGSLLFSDKKRPELKFLSPGSGTIHDIIYGPRRIIEAIVIKTDGTDAHESFASYTLSGIDRTSREELIHHLMNGGMWPLIRQLPFREIARPESSPAAIWVTLGSADPFQPSPQVYLKDRADFFELGVKALARLASQVNICWFDDETSSTTPPHRGVTHRVTGKYPASDPGVVLYHTKKSPSENHDWFIDGQDVALLGQFLKTGIYPVEKIVTISDGTADHGCHVKTRLGVRLKDLLNHPAPYDHSRQWVAGGFFSGYTAGPDQYLAAGHTSLAIIEEAYESELFGFVRPGFKKLSRSRTVLSFLSSSPFSVNADMHGEKRPCINCGYCADVCPVAILPQFVFKSLYADEMEEALTGGLLDCVECGLCTFVCPSKIELADVLIDARHRYHKELNQVAESV